MLNAQLAGSLLPRCSEIAAWGLAARWCAKRAASWMALARWCESQGAAIVFMENEHKAYEKRALDAVNDSAAGAPNPSSFAPAVSLEATR